MVKDILVLVCKYYLKESIKTSITNPIVVHINLSKLIYAARLDL